MVMTNQGDTRRNLPATPKRAAPALEQRRVHMTVGQSDPALTHAMTRAVSEAECGKLGERATYPVGALMSVTATPVGGGWR